MIYSVHCHYRKLNSNKASHKFEGIVFAKDRTKAKEMVRNILSKYPVEIENMSAIGNEDKTLGEIYAERPELIGISPEQGYIYNEYSHNSNISRYVGK